MTETSAQPPTTLTDYLTVLRRRKWIVIVTPIVAALAALQFSSSQPAVYQATAQILVDRSAVQDPATSDPTRYLNTLARIARKPEVAASVAAADEVPRITAGAVLGASNVSPDAAADLLHISVSYGNPDDAVLLANAYAREFTRYKTQSDAAQINDTLRALDKRAARLRKSGLTDSLAYQTLVQEQSELVQARKLVAHALTVLQPAVGAAKIEPRPRRALVLGGLLGAVFALGLAFLAEALDRRVRTEREIQELLGLPLLGRIARPPSSLAKKNRLVMLEEPLGHHAEQFRKLWGTVELVNLQRGDAHRTIMFTSAAQREGKSTTVANFAIALARSGQSVVLVDLDLRRPFLHTFFGVRAEPGFTNVVVGGETLDRAVCHLSLPTGGGLESLGDRNGHPSAAASAPSRPPDAGAILHLLPCGTIPPSAGDFLASERISVLLDKLGEQYEVVLVDAPPITAVGDAMTISAGVDAIIVVSPLGVHRPLLNELARELQNSSAATLGLVLTGAPLGDPYLYWYPSSRDADRLPGTPVTRGGEHPLVKQVPLRKAATDDSAWQEPRSENPGAVDADAETRRRYSS